MNFMPTLALAGTYSFQSLYNDNWNVGQYTWAKNIEYTRKQLDVQVRSYIDNMKANADQVASNHEAIEQAEKGREIASKRYEIGKGTILELNNSEVSLTQAKLTYSQSIYNYLAAKADLDKVLGNDENIKVSK